MTSVFGGERVRGTEMEGEDEAGVHHSYCVASCETRGQQGREHLRGGLAGWRGRGGRRVRVRVDARDDGLFVSAR